MRHLTTADEDWVRQRLRAVLPAPSEKEPPTAAAADRSPVEPPSRPAQAGPLRTARPVEARPSNLARGTGVSAPDPTAAAAHSAQWASDRPEDPVPAGGTVPRLTGLGAFDPGRRGVRSLLAVAVVVVFGAGLLAWWARPRTEPVEVGPAPASMPVVTETASAPAEIVVAVAGRVRKPGLVRLPVGARVADALHAAGGTPPGVDVALLNLARKVVDGELIVVGVTPAPGAAVPGAVAAAPPGAHPAGPVNLNTATLAELDGLPGVGPVLAQRILDHRQRTGGFRSVSDLRRVDGIGSARFDQLKDLVTV